MVCMGDDGKPFAVFKCILSPDAERFPKSEMALAALRGLRAAKAAPWIVILSRGGHFAASVFDPTKFAGGSSADQREHSAAQGRAAAITPAAAVAHKTFHRYVVRAKAGTRCSLPYPPYIVPVLTHHHHIVN